MPTLEQLEADYDIRADIDQAAVNIADLYAACMAGVLAQIEAVDAKIVAANAAAALIPAAERAANIAPHSRAPWAHSSAVDALAAQVSSRFGAFKSAAPERGARLEYNRDAGGTISLYMRFPFTPSPTAI